MRARGSIPSRLCHPLIAAGCLVVLPSHALSQKTPGVEAVGRVVLARSYYVSLCWHGLGRLGLLGEPADPEYEAWARKLGGAGDDFGFAAPVAHGPLFRFLFQIPGALDPQTPEELRQIMQAVKRLLEAGSIEPFLARWPERTRHWSDWYNPVALELIRRDFAGREAAAASVIDAFTDLMVELWHEYREPWREQLRDYPFAEREQRCNALELSARWRRELGVEYPYKEFRVVICPENPTLASSLGPETIVVGAKHGWDRLQNSVVHEFGVRMPDFGRLARDPATAELMLRDYVGFLKIVETEICYRKRRLMPELRDDVFVRGMALGPLMEWRGGQADDGFPGELLLRLHSAAKSEGLLPTEH